MKHRFLIVVFLAIIIANQAYTMPRVVSLQAQTSTYPSVRGGHAMVYDPHNEVVVLYGGFTTEGGFHSLGETWFYDYATNTWTEHISSPYPPARSNLGMVYCNETNEIIVYGGGQAIDTWSFDCETQTWSEIVTVTNPGIHYSHAMAYDSQQNVVVLFGGFGGDGWVRNDTWIFSLTNRDWTEVHPSTTPISRYGHVMTYDETINRIILTAGNCAYIGHQDDTWEYDVSSNTWTRIFTTGNPDRLKWPSMIYDPVNQKDILFGGQVGDTPIDRTWIYDAQLNTWTDADPDVAPPGRINTGLAFDSRFNVTIIFGGTGLDWVQLNDTWAYSYEANTWTDMEGIEGPSTPTSPTGTTTPPPDSIPLVLLAVVIMAPVAIIVMVVLWRFRS